MKNKRGFGFTLIELIVVIGIIALILGVGTIAFENTFQKSRDTQRVTDMTQVQNALKLYYRDEGKYPDSLTFGQPLIGEKSSTTYMSKLPTNPMPRNDGSCADSEYSYATTTTLANQSGYVLNFCLGTKINNINNGVNCLNDSGISSNTSTCPIFNLKSGLSLWLKADGDLTLRYSGSDAYVTEWKDMSGNNNNAIQATEANQPKLLQNTPNNKPALDFNTDFLLTENTVENIKSVFVIARFNQAAFTDYNGLLGGPFGSPNSGYLAFGTPNTPNLDQGQGSMYRNGIYVGSGVADFSPINNYWIGYLLYNTLRSQIIKIGALNDDYFPTRAWDGQVAEVIVYNRALSEIERQKVEQYLSQKYNISL